MSERSRIADTFGQSHTDQAKVNLLVWFILANFFKSCLNMNEKQLRAELDAVYGSISWRITAPLRYFSAFAKRYVWRSLSPKVWLRALIAFVLRSPSLVAFLKNSLTYVPGAKSWAKRLLQRLIPVAQSNHLPAKLELHPESQLPAMSATSLLIYRELQAAIQKQV
jgi:hypothetical protein